MKWQFILSLSLAALVTANPIPQNNNNNNNNNNDNNVDEDVNNAANNGQGGIEAAAGAQAAVLLTENGADGAVTEGQDFEDAVQAIVDSGNQEDIETLELAGIDVDSVVGSNNNNNNSNKRN